MSGIFCSKVSGIFCFSVVVVKDVVVVNEVEVDVVVVKEVVVVMTWLLK